MLSIQKFWTFSWTFLRKFSQDVLYLNFRSGSSLILPNHQASQENEHSNVCNRALKTLQGCIYPTEPLKHCKVVYPTGYNVRHSKEQSSKGLRSQTEALRLLKNDSRGIRKVFTSLQTSASYRKSETCSRTFRLAIDKWSFIFQRNWWLAINSDGRRLNSSHFFKLFATCSSAKSLAARASTLKLRPGCPNLRHRRTSLKWAERFA